MEYFIRIRLYSITAINYRIVSKGEVEMIDYKKIGRRIQEQRRYIKKVSQEQMAEDLMMYQADVSNLEKAKKGSGITNLDRLEIIADYFSISVQSLIFGLENEMIPYFKRKSVIVREQKENESHIKVLSDLLDTSVYHPIIYSSDAYKTYIVEATIERADMPQEMFDKEADVRIPSLSLPRYYFFTFYKDNLVAVMTVDNTDLYMNACPTYIEALQRTIYYKKIDVTDIVRRLNPYSPIISFLDDEKVEEYLPKYQQRITDILSLGENNPVLYIEDVYVIEQARRKGIFTMLLDILNLMFPEAILSLNMEPSKDGLLIEGDGEDCLTPDDTITMKENSIIAQKTGFVVDTNAWGLMVKDTDGKKKKMEVEKCAYFFPKKYHELMLKDGDLVRYGFSLQEKKHHEEHQLVDSNTAKRQESKHDNKPKIEVKFKNVLPLANVVFNKDYKNTDFDSMVIKKIKYGFASEAFMSTSVLHEIHLEDPKTGKDYYAMIVAYQNDYMFYFTMTPFMDSYIDNDQNGIEDDYFIANSADISRVSLEELPEDTKYLHLLQILLGCDANNEANTNRIIKRITGKKVKDVKIKKTSYVPNETFSLFEEPHFQFDIEID